MLDSFRFQLIYILLLVILILGIIYSQSECFIDQTLFETISPLCKLKDKLSKARLIIDNFDTSNSNIIKNAFDNTNQFTISTILRVYQFNDRPGWQHLFHAGTSDTKLRTPGVWINQGYLHVRGSTAKNWNDGDLCYKISPPLEVDMEYHLLLVYNQNSIDVYLDGKHLQSCKTNGNLLVGRDLYLGKDKNEKNGANINMTMTYLPVVFNSQEVNSCWMALKELNYMLSTNKTPSVEGKVVLPKPIKTIIITPKTVAQKPVAQKPVAQKPVAQKPVAQKPEIPNSTIKNKIKGAEFNSSNLQGSKFKPI